MNSQTYHRVVCGKIQEGTLQFEKEIGSCRMESLDHRPYFKLSLWQNATQPYYLVKNKDGKNLTVFSHKAESLTGVCTFRNPVGYGYTNDSLKSHIQLQFNFPWQKVFIDLHPTNKDV